MKKYLSHPATQTTDQPVRKTTVHFATLHVDRLFLPIITFMHFPLLKQQDILGDKRY